MTHAEAVAFINQLEQRHDVQGMVLDDVRIWPLVRMVIGEHLLASLLAPAVPTLDAGHSTARIPLLVKGLLRERPRRGRPAPAQLLFNVHNGQRSMLKDRTVDRFAQPLIEAGSHSGLSSSVIEHLHGVPTAFPELGKPHRYDASPALRALSMLHWRKRQPTTAIVKGLDALLKDVKHVSGAFNAAPLRDRLHSFRFYLRFHSRILRNVGPRCVFVVSWYSVENMALAHACRVLDIGTVDLQHGVQGPGHLAYGRWPIVPREGWSMMPRSFWCWDGTSTRNIDQWAQGTPHRAFALGNPWLERSADFTVGVNWHEDDRKRILFTAQPLVDLLPDPIIEAIKKTCDSMQWIVRTHPTRPQMVVEVKRRLYETGLDGRVVIDEAGSTPLATLLKDCDVHVTQYSSVVLEAGFFGVPSIVLHPTASTLFAELIAQGSVTWTSDTGSLLSLLNSGHRRPAGPSMLGSLENRLATVLECSVGPTHA